VFQVVVMMVELGINLDDPVTSTWPVRRSVYNGEIK